MEVVIGILIPFIGTVLGSMMVYLLKNNISKIVEEIILGFAAGIMVAASIWSLLIPAMEVSKGIVWLPSVIGLLVGMLIFYLIDFYLRKRNEKAKVDNVLMAITIHNVPEGMAVGIAFASYMTGSLNLAVCMALAIGVAIQNFPEGSIVTLPLYKKGYSKNKAFLYGVVSALFELLGAVVTILFTNIVSILLPYLLALAAGAMFYVVIVELIPESNSDNRLNVIGFCLGFLIMMILDVTLG